MENFKTFLIIPHKYGLLELVTYLPTKPIESGEIVLTTKNTIKLKIKNVASSMCNDQFRVNIKHLSIEKITAILNSLTKTTNQESKLIITIPKFNLHKKFPPRRPKKIFDEIRYDHLDIHLSIGFLKIIKIVYQLNESKIIITTRAPHKINEQTLIKYGWSATKPKEGN